MAVAAIAVLSGCGGSSARYSVDAFSACLQAQGPAQTAGVVEALRPIERSDAQVAANAFDAHLPGAGVAAFDSGEYVLFFAGTDQTRARAGAKWLKNYFGTNGVHEEVDRWGNLVVAMHAHPTVGVRKVIDGCRKTAEKT